MKKIGNVTPVTKRLEREGEKQDRPLREWNLGGPGFRAMVLRRIGDAHDGNFHDFVGAVY